MAAPFTIRGLDHVVLRVANIDRAIAFYCDVLGCTIERVVESLGLYQLRAGNALIDLVGLNGPMGEGATIPDTGPGRNMDHFCLRISAFDEKALADHLARHGVDVGESGMRYGAEGSGPSLYITDPEGNVVELKGPPAENGG